MACTCLQIPGSARSRCYLTLKPCRNRLPRHRSSRSSSHKKRATTKFAPLALEPKPAKNILLLADAHGPAADFAAAAEEAFLSGGDRVFRAKLLDHGAIPNGDGRAAVANDSDDMAALLESLRSDGFVPDQIVNLAGLAPLDPKVPKALAELQDRKCLAVINLIQALARNPLSGPSPRLTLVSLRAHPEPSSNALSDPAQAPVWGLGRVIANEQRDLRCRMIDLHMPLERACAARLVEEIASDTNETEVLLTPQPPLRQAGPVNLGCGIGRVRPATAQRQSSLTTHFGSK